MKSEGPALSTDLAKRMLNAICGERLPKRALVVFPACLATTADALAEWGDDYSNLIVCGGGRLNHHLMERLAHFATGNVQASEHFGVNGDAIEAGLFAWLAYRTLAGLPGNAAAVTGAADARVLGAIYTGATP